MNLTENQEFSILKRDMAPTQTKKARSDNVSKVMKKLSSFIKDDISDLKPLNVTYVNTRGLKPRVVKYKSDANECEATTSF